MSRKLIVVLGPTASGKSKMAVRLAKKLDGEIISADSRQVYKGMDIGTGKVPRDQISNFQFPPGRLLTQSAGQAISKQILNPKFQIQKQPYFYKRIEHHLLDVASPKRKFTVVQYRKLALEAITKIFKKGKTPILCGGTGFYIQTVVDGLSIPQVSPDWKLRKKLEKKSTDELYSLLKKLDFRRAKIIERKNKRRLIRAIEIVTKTKKPIPSLKREPLPYPVLFIGIKKKKDGLKRLIKKRLLIRLKGGMIAEVKKLKKSGLSWKRLEELGLEYKYVAQYLQGKLKYQEMIEKLEKEINNFAKRQITWFKRNGRIHWVKNQKGADVLVKNFLF